MNRNKQRDINKYNYQGKYTNEKTRDIPFHTMTVEETLLYLNTSLDGLTDEEAVIRRAIYGSNVLEESKGKSIIVMFLEQFKSVMVIILLVAAAISGCLKEITDTVIILAVVIINAALGVIQESKAERALDALKKLSVPYSKVKRNNTLVMVKTGEIVPGDVAYLEAGDFVPADMRLVESVNLKIEEAALTGESVPVEKFTGVIHEKDIVAGDRKNMAFSGCSVTYGRGMGVVTSMGMNTEVGKIAGHIAKAESEETPLQEKLTEMGKYVSVAVIAIAAIIFITGMLKGRELLEMFLISVSLAVAAIPEGLPAVVTIVLAIGVQKMSRQNAIIRKLPAVETLGSTNIICSDKTGTLTQNKMTVTEVFLDGEIIPANSAFHGQGQEHEHEKSFIPFIEIMTLCNDSKVNPKPGMEDEIIGDPTETALVHFAASKGFSKIGLEEIMPRINEIPFDSDRKLMTTINKRGETYMVLTKGAPDMLLKRCGKILLNGEVVPLTKSHIEKVEEANGRMAAKALRVLAMAYKEIDSIPGSISQENIEQDLVFVGLTGMIDPPRPEVKDAVNVCKQAGIRPIMISGDYKDTAIAIALELGIINDDRKAITGNELDKISEELFENSVEKYSVYSRVSPQHKVRIVKAWKKKDMVVAMTGDGVNDAPALKTADIGVGMGITGTDVSKSVSDMVLADDNFATIVTAVKEGRRIYSNIRKVIQYLLSANIGEVITLLVATMLNWSILFPVHILWINLLTDTFPALALGVEQADRDIMTRKPVKSGTSIFSGGLGTSIIYQGFLEGLATLFAYYTGIALYSPNVAITMAFATLGLIQLIHAFNVRSGLKPVSSVSFASNKYLLVALLLSAFLQVSVIVIPYMNGIFRVTPLNPAQWLIVGAASLSIVPLVELAKVIQRTFIQEK